jgi:molybdate transport system substrate-binding protein
MPIKLQHLIVELLLLSLAACSTTPSATKVAIQEITTTINTPVTLTVMAAASLMESFTEIGQLFEAANPGVKVIFSFAGSQQLEQQLNQGATADVFASAAQNYMDAAIKDGRVTSGNVQIFAKNRLVVIYPIANPAGLTKLQDLARSGLKLDLADKSVPVGNYSLIFLANASKDASFGPSFLKDVLKNVVSYEENVKSVVTKVSLGEADAGICYATDITLDMVGKLGKLDIPEALNVVAVYPIAQITNSSNPKLAHAFVNFVLSTQGQQVLTKYGFILTP